MTPGGGGWKKGGGRKTSRRIPLPQKRALGPPSSGTFSSSLGVGCSVFPVQESKTQHTRSSFGEVRKICWSLRCLVRFPPPIRFEPPHIMSAFLKHAFREVTSGFCKGTVPGAPPLPSPGSLRMLKNNSKETYLVPPEGHISVKNM